MGLKVFLFFSIAAIASGSVIEKTRHTSRLASAATNLHTVDEGIADGASTLSSAHKDAIKPDEEYRDDDNKTRKTRAANYFDDNRDFHQPPARRIFERLNNPSRTVRAAGNFNEYQEHKSPKEHSENIDYLTSEDSEHSSGAKADGGLDRGPPILPQETSDDKAGEEKMEKLSNLSRLARQIFCNTPRLRISSNYDPVCPATCPVICPTTTTPSPCCVQPSSENNEPTKKFYLSYPQMNYNTPQPQPCLRIDPPSCPTTCPPACPVTYPPACPTTTTPSPCCIQPSSKNNGPTKTFYLYYPQTTNKTPQPCLETDPPSCPTTCPPACPVTYPTTATSPPCCVLPPSAASSKTSGDPSKIFCLTYPNNAPAKSNIAITDPSKCPYTQKQGSTCCTAPQKKTFTCCPSCPSTDAGTTGVMRLCGNGEGGNSMRSSMNVLCGPSCNDPCSNKKVCMMSYCGNGRGGNNVSSCVNYINGGNMLCHCGGGVGGNKVESCYNIVCGDGASLIDGSSGTTILQSLINCFFNQKGCLLDLNCPKCDCPKCGCPKCDCPKCYCPKCDCPKCDCPKCNCPDCDCCDNGSDEENDPCCYQPTSAPPVDPCSSQTVYTCSSIPADPCNTKPTTYSCIPEPCQPPTPTRNVPPCVICPGCPPVYFSKKK